MFFSKFCVPICLAYATQSFAVLRNPRSLKLIDPLPTFVTLTFRLPQFVGAHSPETFPKKAL